MTINVQVAAKWRNNIKIRVVNISEVHVDVRQQQGRILKDPPLLLSYADSNHDKQNQNLLCYHYTIRQSYKSAAKLSFLYKTTKKKRAFLIVFA